MRNTFFLLLFLISGACFSQNPDPFWDGIRTKLVQPDTLSTFDRDAITPKLGTILYHKDTGVSRWEKWDGTAWVPFGESVEWGNITGTLSDQTDLQSALNAKQATITGAASTIVTSDLTNNRALISDGSGKVEVSAVTTTELSYLSGVTSALQTQLDAKLPTASYTAADVFSKVLSLDGSGSGLDADLLRGVHWGNVDTDIITSGNITATGSTAGNYLNIRKASTGSDTVGEFGNTTIDNGLQVVTDGNLDWGFNALNNRNLVFRTNQIERLRISSSGNLTATGAGEFGGTVSGDDPVNDDDFVTKGYVASNYGAPYLKYVALITQSGTSAPTAHVLENTLGGTVVWSRTSTGTYRATLAGVFTENKTAVYATLGVSANDLVINEVIFFRASPDYITLATRANNAYVDSNIADLTVEIRVYP